MLKYHKDHSLSIIFSDESRFFNVPDNQCHWIRNDDFREEMCAKYEKFKFGTMVWEAIGYGFKSQLIFPRGKITAESYRNYIDKSNIFAEADQVFGKYNYYFQQDGAPSHCTSGTYKHLEQFGKILYG